jgi:ankyrin repeat protein
MPRVRFALAALILLTAFAATSTAQNPDFFEAARAGDVPKLQKLLADGTPINTLINTLINQRGEHSRTALHEAAAHCRVNAARFLIEHGAEVQAMDDSAATPADLAAQCAPEIRSDFQTLMPHSQLNGALSLQNAIAHRQAQLVSMLVSIGFSVNAMAADGDRPLNTAAAAGDATTTRLLLEHGADPNLPSRSGSTPLHDAALHGDAEAISLLLAHGARINTPTLDDGSTALHLAASFDRLDAVKTLVQHGADTTLKNAKGFTAADLAARNKFADVSAYLASGH